MDISYEAGMRDAETWLATFPIATAELEDTLTRVNALASDAIDAGFADIHLYFEGYWTALARVYRDAHLTEWETTTATTDAATAAKYRKMGFINGIPARA